MGFDTIYLVIRVLEVDYTWGKWHYANQQHKSALRNSANFIVWVTNTAWELPDKGDWSISKMLTYRETRDIELLFVRDRKTRGLIVVSPFLFNSEAK